MRLEERMRLVKQYFATVSDEQLERDMRKAGMGKVASWRELGIRLVDDDNTSYPIREQIYADKEYEGSFDHIDILRKAA